MTEEIIKKKCGNPNWARKRLINGDILSDGSVYLAKNTVRSLRENPQVQRRSGRHPGGAKKRHRKVLLAYLSNADNPIIRRRQDYLKILGLSTGSPGYINYIFTRDELSEIEAEGLANRRKAYAPRLAMVDNGLFEKASQGNAPEVKLVYQRFEDWSEKTISENRNLNVDVNLTERLVEALKKGRVHNIEQTEGVVDGEVGTG